MCKKGHQGGSKRNRVPNSYPYRYTCTIRGMAIKTVKELGSWPAYWDQFPMGKSNGHTALYFAA